MVSICCFVSFKWMGICRLTPQDRKRIHDTYRFYSRFYSSMGNPSDTEGLTTPKTNVPINAHYQYKDPINAKKLPHFHPLRARGGKYINFFPYNFCTEVQGDIRTGPPVPWEVYHLRCTHSQRTATTPGISCPTLFK